MTLGDKLLHLRKQSKLTQEDVAEQLNVTRQTVSNWELNQTAPNLTQAKELSKLYKVSLDELIDNDIKDLLTEKISNTEKLAGLIIKILKIIAILIVGYFIIMIITIFLFSFNKKIVTKETMTCHLNDESFTYGIEYDSNNRIVSAGGDSYIANVLDLEKYEYADQVRDSIKDYFKVNGGQCK